MKAQEPLIRLRSQMKGEWCSPLSSPLEASSSCALRSPFCSDERPGAAEYLLLSESAPAPDVARRDGAELGVMSPLVEGEQSL